MGPQALDRLNARFVLRRLEGFRPLLPRRAESPQHTGVKMKHPRATAPPCGPRRRISVVATAQDAAAARGDPAKAQPIVNTVCAACHGADGTAGNQFAGQHASYLYKQLSDCCTAGAKNAVMSKHGGCPVR